MEAQGKERVGEERWREQDIQVDAEESDKKLREHEVGFEHAEVECDEFVIVPFPCHRMSGRDVECPPQSPNVLSARADQNSMFDLGFCSILVYNTVHHRRRELTFLTIVRNRIRIAYHLLRNRLNWGL